MKKKKSYAQLKRELDRVFSLYVRWKAADKNGLVECFTCGEKKSVKQMQAGHFIPRQYLSLRWSVDNTKPQCPRCNIWLKGNYPNFAFALGPEALARLLNDKHLGVKFSAQELQGMIDSVKADLATLGVRT